MSRFTLGRLVACGAVLVASCGNGETSPDKNRQLNSVPCFATQSDKDQAVADAQDELDTVSKVDPSNSAVNEALAIAEDLYQQAVNDEKVESDEVLVLEAEFKTLQDEWFELDTVHKDLAAEAEKVLANKDAKAQDKSESRDREHDAFKNAFAASKAVNEFEPTLARARNDEAAAKRNTEALQNARDAAQTDVDNWKSGGSLTVEQAQIALDVATAQMICDSNGLETSAADDSNSNTPTHFCSYTFPDGSEDIDRPNFNLDSEMSTGCEVDVEVGGYDGSGNNFTFRNNGEVVHVFYLEADGETATEFTYGESNNTGTNTNSQENDPGDQYVCNVEFLELGLSWDCPSNVKIYAYFEEPKQEYEFEEVCVSSGIVGEKEVGHEDFQFSFVAIDQDNNSQILFDGFSGDFDGTHTFVVPFDQADLCNGSESSQTEASGCEATFTDSGMSWSCANDYKIGVWTLDYEQNQGRTIECVSGGEIESSRFQFYFFGDPREVRFSGNSSDFDGTVQFDVPFKNNNCYPQPVPELTYSGVFSDQGVWFELTIPEDFEEAVVIDIKFPCEIEVGFEVDANFYSDSYYTDELCGQIVEVDSDPGIYPIYLFRDSEGDVSWSSNLNIVEVPVVLPPSEFNYTYEQSQDFFVTLTESTDIVLTASAGETCSVWDDGSGRFADPEIYVYDATTRNFVDLNSDSGRGLGNCSASLLQLELRPGSWIIRANNESAISVPINLGSNIELTKKDVEYSLNSQTVKGGESLEVVVPEGGSWFWAETLTGQSYSQTRTLAGGLVTNATGCIEVDGDINTEDDGCIYTYSVIRSMSGDSVTSEGVANMSYSTGDGEITYYVYSAGDSRLEVFLNGGTYVLSSGLFDFVKVASDSGWELKYGFGTTSHNEPMRLDIVEVDAPPPPESPAIPALPVSVLTESGNSTIAISNDVKSMVCDGSCIESLFSSAGLAEGIIIVTIGDDSVPIGHGQALAIIPVDSHASRIKVKALSADGTRSVNLSAKIDRISISELTKLRDNFVAVAPQSSATTLPANPTTLPTFPEQRADSSIASYSAYWWMLLVLILIGGWMFIVIRRRKSDQVDL